MQHKIIAVKPTPKGFVTHTITFIAMEHPYRTSVLSLIQDRDDLHDCYILDEETLCPVTFDFTVVLQSVTGKGSYKSDQWACTYNQFKSLFSDMVNRPHFVSHHQPFCRAIRGEDGKAGEFFTLHDNGNFNKYRDGSVPFSRGLLNSPAHNFK